jgi:hypothetical protein
MSNLVTTLCQGLAKILVYDMCGINMAYATTAAPNTSRKNCGMPDIQHDKI